MYYRLIVQQKRNCFNVMLLYCNAQLCMSWVCGIALVLRVNSCHMWLNADMISYPHDENHKYRGACH